MKYKNRKDAKRKYKQALLATVATMTLGVSTLGSTASAFATEQPVQELPKAFLNDLSGELNSPSINSEEVNKIMSDAFKDSRRLNDLLRQISMGVAGKIPAVGSVVSAMVGYLYPEQDGTDSKLNALESRLTAKIEQTVDNQHVKDIKSHIKNLENAANELQTALNSVNKGTFYNGGSVKDIHGTLREKAETVDKKFKELIPFLMQEGHEIGDLPVYTKVAAAHILFLNYMKTRGTDSKLYRYDSANTVDAQFQPADRVNTYAKHIEDTFKKGDDKIRALIEQREAAISEKHHYASMPSNLSTAKKIHELDGIISGWKDLKLEDKQSIYGDLTIREGSFEAVSCKKLTYTKSGFITEEGKTYYYSPNNDFKNWNGQSFNKGEMVTGWVNLNDEYFFFATGQGNQNDNNDTATQVVFNKGEMMTGWVLIREGYAVAKDGSWYYLNDKPEYGTIGHTLIGNGYNLKNQKGETHNYNFNLKGVWE
ncbi:TPA: insecticidal delta-endotoxin Cry8Ea1 family protein [Bacillus cereus]|uniref:insecticidal delta-endotoxin Cry8Ea1 family protein n=1 Tax=Bacillus cereus TaxID=1396 RepID=UPI00065C0335|nr:insecticidal delta-endotoxin Cry8Ea1 family protein [Bacillus cereus]KMQ22137.1 hypothetical protein TU58_30230 [Bacillus cereus]